MSIQDAVIVIAGIIRDSEGRILLGKREKTPYRGMWEFPGGKIEEGETPVDCLKREIREELNAEIEVNDVFDVASFVYPDVGWHIIIFYNAKISDIEKTNIVNCEYAQISWVEKERLKKLDILEADFEVVEKIIRI